MSKTYNLTATLNTGRLRNSDWVSGAWTKFFYNSDDPVGYSGFDSPRYYATNMLFDQTTLQSLRNKVSNGITVTGLTLEVNCVQPMTGETYIGYKYNSTASGDSNSNAWARSTNVDNAPVDETADSLAYIIPQQTLSSGTQTFNLKRTTPFSGIPKYGLVAGPRRLVSGRWSFTSAILHVTTSEVTISYKKGASGAGPEHTDVVAPNSNLRGAIFERTGYTQTGWATSDGGAKVYNLSAKYTGTADLTLYPYWTADTYTVTYAPGSYSSGSNYTDTKTYGVALTLRGATYTRANYSQDGWSINSNGSTKDYNLSGSYTNNAQITLYPHWKADTYTVSYNANGGSGAPSAQTKTYGVSLTLSSTAPTRTNYIFLGWATSATGAVAYQPGGSYTANAAVTLYAIWQAAKSTLSTITSSVNIGSSGTASWNIVNSAYTYKLVITYSNAPAVTVNVAANTASTSFTIPTTWYAYLPNVTSVTATATLTTYSGSTSLGSTTKTFTVSVASSVKPTISSFTHAPYSQNSTVNGWGVYVQGYSQVDLSVSATAGTGASIVSILFTGTGVSQSSTATTARSSVLSNTGYVGYSVTVTDSRGRTASLNMTGNNRPYFYEYSNPVVISMTAFRSNSSGVEDAISGTYIRTSASFTFSSCGNKNSLSVKKIEYKLHTASSWTSGVATATSGTAYTIGGGNIAITSSYDVRCVVTDALSHTTTYVVLVPPIVGFAVGLNNDRARFGGPVEKAGLQVDWDAEFNGVVDVTKRRCLATLSSAGWYRVLVFNSDSANHSNGYAGSTIDFNIGYKGQNETHKISLHIVNGNIKFDCENSVSYSQLIDKIRYTRNGAVGYVDLHILGECSGLYVDFIVHDQPTKQYQYVAASLVGVDPSPSGETEVTRYTFAANTNGLVTNLFSTSKGTVLAYRSGDMVTLEFVGSSTTWTEDEVFMTVADGAKPALAYLDVTAYIGRQAVIVRINQSGDIVLWINSTLTSNQRLYFSATYPILH